jgi:hypothetical protein
VAAVACLPKTTLTVLLFLPLARAQEPGGPDWNGQIQFNVNQPVPTGTQLFYGGIVLKFERDGDGNLTGEAIGTQKQDLNYAGCPSRTVAPGQLRGKLTGRYSSDANTMTLNLLNVQFTAPRVTPCPSGGLPGTSPSVHTYPGFEQVLGGLRPDTEDGAFTSMGQWTSCGGRAPCTVTHKVNIKPVTRTVPRGG